MAGPGPSSGVYGAFAPPPTLPWLGPDRRLVFTVAPIRILPGADSPARPEVLSCLPKKGPKEGHPDCAREPRSGRAGPAALNSLRLRLRSDIQRLLPAHHALREGLHTGGEGQDIRYSGSTKQQWALPPESPRRPRAGAARTGPRPSVPKMSEDPAFIHWHDRRDSRCLDLPPRCRRAEWRGFSREKRRWMSERSEFSAAREKPRSEGNPGPRSGPGSRQSGVFLGYFFARAKKYLAARSRVSAGQYVDRRHVNTSNEPWPATSGLATGTRRSGLSARGGGGAGTAALAVDVVDLVVQVVQAPGICQRRGRAARDQAIRRGDHK